LAISSNYKVTWVRVGHFCKLNADFFLEIPNTSHAHWPLFIHQEQQWHHHHPCQLMLRPNSPLTTIDLKSAQEVWAFPTSQYQWCVPHLLVVKLANMWPWRDCVVLKFSTGPKFANQENIRITSVLFKLPYYVLFVTLDPVAMYQSCNDFCMAADVFESTAISDFWCLGNKCECMPPMHLFVRCAVLKRPWACACLVHWSTGLNRKTIHVER